MPVRDLEDISKTKPTITPIKRRVRRGKRWVTKEFWRYCIPLLNKTAAEIEACFTFYYLENWGEKHVYQKICSGRVTVSKTIVKPLGTLTGGAMACCEANFNPIPGATVLCMIGDCRRASGNDVDWRTGTSSGSIPFRAPKRRRAAAGREGFFGARLGWRLAKAKNVRLEAIWDAPLGWELDYGQEKLGKSWPAVIPYSITPPADARLGEFASLELKLVAEGKDGPVDESEFVQFVVTESSFLDDRFEEDAADPTLSDEYEEDDGAEFGDPGHEIDLARVARELEIVDQS